MVATVKIIPFAVDRALVDGVGSLLAASEIFAVQPVQADDDRLCPDHASRAEGERACQDHPRDGEPTGAVGQRQSGTNCVRRTKPGRLTEAIKALAAAKSDMVIVFGASALCDFDDVIPAAIRQAGGEVLRSGMPVDPGNLMVLGRLGGKPVIGAPGCARSPRENGFDWVLDRLTAGLDVTAGDIAGMGVGGLLMEIPTRPQPRETAVSIGRREGARRRARRRPFEPHGRAEQADGAFFRQAADPPDGRACAGVEGFRRGGGHRPSGRANPRGLGRAATSALRTIPILPRVFQARSRPAWLPFPDDAAGVLIVLGDMPAVSSADLDRLIAAFRKAGGQAIVRATHDGKRGNPVLLPRALFGAVAQLEGDTGARHLVEAGLMPVVDVEIGEGAAIDVDTRDALESAGGVLQD